MSVNFINSDLMSVGPNSRSIATFLRAKAAAASCLRNICTKDYWKLIILFKVTIEPSTYWSWHVSRTRKCLGCFWDTVHSLCM